MSTNKTPQVFLIGKIVGGKNFESRSIYLKFQFQSGTFWKLISGLAQGETFQSTADEEELIPLEHHFELNYVAKCIRGWPKLQVEVWEVNDNGRNKIAGYGILSIPMSPGFYSLDIHTFKPLEDWPDKFIGSSPELINKEFLVASEGRFGFKTKSSGQIEVEIHVFTKDFQLHGLDMGQKYN